MRKYVHRVGRTARAGRAGDAWTLVEEQEVRVLPILKNIDAETFPLQARYFKSMLKETDHLERVKRLRVSDKDVSHMIHHYDVSVAL